MRSYSLISMMMSGVRIAGESTLTPAHINAAGAQVNDRVGVPVISNSHYGKDREGKPGRSDNFRLIAWGPLGLSVCRYGSTGKALDVIVEPQSYEGVVYKMAPNPTNPAEMTPQVVVVGGQSLTTEKIAFRILSISYGEESAKQIQRELSKWASEPGNIGGRPPQWNIIGSQDAATYTQVLEARKGMVWDGQSPFFGFARIIMPRNAQRILTTEERAAAVAASAAKRGAFSNPAAQTNNTVNQVAATFQTGPAPLTTPAPATILTPLQATPGVPTTPLQTAPVTVSQGF